ncbi:copper homeostasis protein CutC, partial [Francisella tularensis]|uniref:copper homeostasis protein CutC n=1 Tax=Francisella tularensis TaxID=263 RepID=UPI002381CA91
IMVDDLKSMLELYLYCIVIVALTRENKIDKNFLELFIKLTKKSGKELTFHRAIDLIKDIYTATQEIIYLGFDRILTSGTA